MHRTQIPPSRAWISVAFKDIAVTHSNLFHAIGKDQFRAICKKPETRQKGKIMPEMQKIFSCLPAVFCLHLYVKDN